MATQGANSSGQFMRPEIPSNVPESTKKLITSAFDAIETLYQKAASLANGIKAAESSALTGSDAAVLISNMIQGAKDNLDWNVEQLQIAIATALSQALEQVRVVDAALGDYKADMAGYFEPVTADGSPAGVRIKVPGSLFSQEQDNEKINFLYGEDRIGYIGGVQSELQRLNVKDVHTIGNSDEGYVDMDMTPIGLAFIWRT